MQNKMRGLLFFEDPSTYYILAVIWLVVGYMLSQGSLKSDPVQRQDLLKLNGQLKSCSFLNSEDYQNTPNKHILELSNYSSAFKVESSIVSSLAIEEFQANINTNDPVEIAIKQSDSLLINEGKTIPVYSIESKGQFYLYTSDAQYEERYMKYVKRPLFALIFFLLSIFTIWLGILRSRYDNERRRSA